VGLGFETIEYKGAGQIFAKRRMLEELARLVALSASEAERLSSAPSRARNDSAKCMGRVFKYRAKVAGSAENGANHRRGESARLLFIAGFSALDHHGSA